MIISENSIFIYEDDMDEFLESIDPNYCENYQQWNYPNIAVKEHILDRFKDSYLATDRNHRLSNGITLYGFTFVFASKEDLTEFRLRFL